MKHCVCSASNVNNMDANPTLIPNFNYTKGFLLFSHNAGMEINEMSLTCRAGGNPVYVN